MGQLGEEKNVQDYLGKTFSCACGKEHRTAIEHVLIEAGALGRVPTLIGHGNFKKVLLVCDDNTAEVAGKELYEKLLQVGCKAKFHQIPVKGEELLPDEFAVGSILMMVDSSVDLILAVGSGTINDLCRYVSTRVGLPYIIVATAPSMDGYASTVAALLLDGVKTTESGHEPWAIVGDTDLLSKAPSRLMQAGCGDILGKYICLTDWKLSQRVTGEYYCDKLEGMVRSAVAQVVDNIEGVARGEAVAVENLMKALVLSGIAMSFAGNSRPASGSEHHLSHFWEMNLLAQGQTPHHHGIQVGVGAVIMAGVYHMLSQEPIDWKGAPFSTAEQRERVEVSKKKWEQINELIVTEVPTKQELVRLLKIVGAPTKASEILVDKKLLHESLLGAKALRDRYTLFWLLEDLGLLEEFAQRIVEGDS